MAVSYDKNEGRNQFSFIAAARKCISSANICFSLSFTIGYVIIIASIKYIINKLVSMCASNDKSTRRCCML
jgi:hypothetical protein